jgi:hypothetical protein
MISIIYSCMNREKNLLSSLYSWVGSSKYITEIVVVDWSSYCPLIMNREIENLVSNKTIKLLRVEKETYFSLTKSYNLAFDNTLESNKIVLKLDSDYELINNKWFDYLSFSANSNELNNYFIVGNYRFSKSLTGFLLINKKNFVYYNENFNGWGYDDQDLYIKVQEKNKTLDKVVFFDIKNYINHIEHTEQERIQNYENKDKEKSREKNKEISEINNCRKISNYKIIEEKNNYIRMERILNV